MAKRSTASGREGAAVPLNTVHLRAFSNEVMMAGRHGAITSRYRLTGWRSAGATQQYTDCLGGDNHDNRVLDASPTIRVGENQMHACSHITVSFVQEDCGGYAHFSKSLATATNTKDTGAKSRLVQYEFRISGHKFRSIL